jgi:hypothetical protein
MGQAVEITYARLPAIDRLRFRSATNGALIAPDHNVHLHVQFSLDLFRPIA